VEFGILGPLEVRSEGQPVAVPGSKQRQLLAILLLHANEVVGSERLIEALWQRPPASGVNALQVRVSQLRKALGAGGAALETKPSGYLLRLQPGQLDLDRFEHLVAEAQQAADPGESAAKLREALALWRGPPLAEFAYEDFAQSALARLEERRLTALERRIDADLELGHHSEVIGELEQLNAEHPLRERPRAQLMLALYRSGRQAEALDVFQKTRRVLVEELGIDPGSALQQLEKAILRQDPDLQLAALEAPEGSVAATPFQEPEPPLETGEVAPRPVRRERKVVSVLFCELAGSSASSQREDPEDVQARTDRYHRLLRSAIESFGGTIDKFIGHGVVAVFGAPIAHEDDSERAVRAGLRILELAQELNEEEPESAVHVRIGIDTGETVVSLAADPERGEGLVTGDVVNTAARIQAAAPVDGVAVSPETYQQTRLVFVYEPLPPSKTEPAQLFRPLEPRARFGTDVLRTHDAPFVGRELECRLLQDLFDRTARDRSPQLVTVVGEPGIGKSRLVAELFRYTDSLPELVTWRQGRCLPYGDGITFWALGELVKAHAGIYESDAPEIAAEKLEAVLAEVEERPWLRARLLPLLGIDSGQPASRAESFTAWRRFLESIASDSPAVIVVEDLHWADPALLDFLTYLAEWAEGVPLLLLCTARPELYERNAAWGAGLTNQTAIRLTRLSDVETARLVSALLDQALLPAETQQLLLERAGGNPLYAEEFVRMLHDRGLLAPNGTLKAGVEVSFPDSLKALIAARLDTLNPDRKSLLQDASVLGKLFWAGALVAMGDRDPREVELALHELSRKELVRPARTSSMEGEAEYGFWHLLVRDVCYSQIPRAARASRHRAAAGWIEQKAAGRVEDLADVLAHHYTSALELAQAAGDSEHATELTGPARRYLALAGERALGLDTVQAEARLARALELTPGDDPERPELIVRWADAAFQAGRPREAADALEQALTSFRAHGDTDAEARTLILFSRVASWLGEGRHLALAAEALTLLGQAEPGAALVAAYTQLAAAEFVSGNYAEAIAAAEQAVSLAERLGLPVPARALGFHGVARAFLGDPDGLTEMERALVLLIEQGAGRDAAVVQNNLAVARYPLEGSGRSLAAFEQAVTFSEQRGLAETAASLAGNCPGMLVELGRTQEALAQAAALAAALEASGDTHSLIELRALELATQLNQGDTHDATDRADWLLDTARELASADLSVLALAAAAAGRRAAGQPDQARALLTELEQTPGTHENLNYAVELPAMVRTALAAGDPSLARTLTDGLQPRFPLHEHAHTSAQAQLAEAAGDHAKAAALYAEAAERWHQFGNLPERAYALLGHGRCLLALGHAGAEVPLTEARELFSSMGYKPALAETDAMLEQTTAAAS
jgi:DNA-binding SARP family transcriptional activator